jgi:hypothetical protein
MSMDCAPLPNIYDDRGYPPMSRRSRMFFTQTQHLGYRSCTPTNPHKPHKEEGRGPDKSLGSSQAPRTSQNTPTASFGE